MLRLAVDNTRTAPAAPLPTDRHRRALLAKVHLAAKALGMEEDDYRAVLRRVTKLASAKECSNAQLVTVMAEFERLGFKGAKAPHSRGPAASHPVAKKARALWISLHQLGAINDASEPALESFARRQLGVERLEWADQRQGFRLIEALKAIAARHGWDQQVPPRMSSAEQVRLLKERLRNAQLAKLAALGVWPAGAEQADVAGWSRARLHASICELADRLRAAGTSSR